jgi:putative pyruvate formate lyase activating enzyme
MADGFEAGVEDVHIDGESTLLPTACELCPRRCHVNRAVGEVGWCGADDSLRVARAALHRWEEPPISGVSGSGTVFFSNCTMRCVYCQNVGIAHGDVGRAVSVERLAQIFCEQQRRGANNLNLVTPTHYAPQIKTALRMARAAGCTLPVVYNTGGYETVEAIHGLLGFVDVYLTDFKYASPELSQRYSSASDYTQVALAALDAMVEQVGAYALGGLDRGSAINPLSADEDPVPLLTRGIIVRHLMLPGQLEDSKAVVRLLHDSFGDAICLSLMNQYTPLPYVADWPELMCTVLDSEYDELIDYALDLGVSNSFMQEGGAAEESFIPDFDYEGVDPVVSDSETSS